jgi:hypothetical protein
MKLKRIVCMLMITLLVSSCKITHDLALSKKPTTDEIVLTEVELGENNTPEGLPERIAGHKVTYSDVNKTEAIVEQPAVIKVNKTNWWLIALVTLPPLLVLLYVINRKVAKKLNENAN